MQRPQNTRIVFVDPPNGWQHGFPRQYDPYPNQTFSEWLLECGYPKKDLELAVKHSRYWIKEEGVN